MFYDTFLDAAWHADLVQNRPDLVAEVLISFGRALLRHGEMSFPDLWHLPRNRTFAGVAKHVTGPLLRAFPVRAKAAQLGLLRELLWSGLVHLETEDFRQIIEAKLRAASMTKAQRTHWLAAGFALEPPAFQLRLTKAAERLGSRVKPLAQFFAPVSGLWPPNSIPVLTHRLTPSAMAFLIETLGAVFPPIHESELATIRDETVYTVQRLIDQLAASPEPEATRSLAKLRADPDLTNWRHQLRAAWDTQRIVRRDAEYRSPTPVQVMQALEDGPPANAADLRELALDRLQQIAREVPSTNADLWQFFWNQDSHGKLTEPKPENPCRDALLEILSQRLPDGCDVQREGQYAGNRRADLRIASGKWNIPVEIKKNTHSDLLGAVRNQLLPRYTNDPATEGLGIYLVLWFGPQRTVPVSEGPRPGTAGELKDPTACKPGPRGTPPAAVVVMDVTAP